MNALIISHRQELVAALRPQVAAAGFNANAADYSSAASVCDTLAFPALVVIDGPSLEAWNLCRRIRARPDGNLAVIDIVADTVDEEMRITALAAGADDCLEWPAQSNDFELHFASAARQVGALEEIPRSRQTLEENAELWSRAQRGARAGVWDTRPGDLPLDSPDLPVWYSPEMKQLFGFSDDEFPNVLASWLARVEPSEVKSVLEAIIKSLETKAEFEIEYRFRHKSGEYIWISGRGQGIYDAEGKFVRITGSVRDITENRRVANALQASEARWRSLVENAPDIITVAEPDGTIRFTNRPWPGMTTADSIGKNLISLAPTYVRDKVRTSLENVVRSGQAGRFEVTLIDAEGNAGTFASRVGPIHRPDGVTALMVITTDITLRKRAEEEREQFVATIENSSDFIGMMGVSGKFLHLNPAGCRLIGLQDQASANHLSLAEVYSTDSHARYADEIMPAVNANGRWSGEIRFRNLTTNQAIDVHQKIFLIRNPKSGDPLCLATISRDIRAFKLHEQELEQERELLRRLLDLHERDRQLVAYEIHDGLAQEMAAALMHLQSFQHAAGSELAGKEFDRGLYLLQKAVQETRRLISGLRPPVLDELGIIAAIEYLINEVRPDIPDVQFEHRTKFDRLAPPLESAIFRIVQEALSNIQAHSGSRRAKVELMELGQHLRLVVRDWGKGFEMANVSKGRFGLQSIQQRGRLLGAKVLIDSAPGQGTSVVVDFPMIPDRKEDNSERGVPAAK